MARNTVDQMAFDMTDYEKAYPKLKESWEHRGTLIRQLLAENAELKARIESITQAQAQARARRSDPGTSHAAAKSVKNVRDSHKAVLKVYEAYGELTDEQLTGYYGSMQKHHMVPPQSTSGLRTRRRELADLGLVCDTGKRRKLRSGREAVVWAATP
jgi:hypothetical protein